MNKGAELKHQWKIKSSFPSSLYRILFAVIVFIGLGGMTPRLSFAASDRVPLLTTPATTDLGQYMIDQIDNRIAGFSTTQGGFRSLWTKRGNMTGGWQYNTLSLWSNQGAYALDFTGASPWNSFSGYAYGATLISPRHVLLASHTRIPTGTQIIFVDQNNLIITRTLVNQKQIILNTQNTDMTIGVLDADVPNSIAFYPLISYNDVLHHVYRANIPIIRLDQSDTAFIQDIGIGGVHVLSNSIIEFASTGSRAPYSSYYAIGGDSGNPNFAVIGDRLVLLGAQYSGQGFPNVGGKISEIDAAMDYLGGGYHVAQLDLSHFITYDPPSIPNQSMSVVEQSAVGTVVGTVKLNGGNNNLSPIKYEITAGNVDYAFRINSSTGVITVDQPNIIDFSKIQTFTLTVSVQDSSVAATPVTGTVSISISYNPNIAHPTVSVPGSYIWTERPGSGSRSWANIGTSANGKELAAAESSGYVWTSADYGVTWTIQSAAGNRNWSSIVMSSDGSHLIALDYSHGSVWTATTPDAGVTWSWTERTNVGVGIHNWIAATLSSDGTKLAIIGDGVIILTSSDAGASWTEHTIPGEAYQWQTITSSADGSKFAIGGSIFNLTSYKYSSAIFTSTDAGTNWIQRLTSINPFYSLASSANGAKLVAGTDVDINYINPSIYTSSDSGATWVPQNGSGINSWQQVLSSGNGSRLAAFDGQYVWISKDAGLSWSRDVNTPQSTIAVALSSDGSTLAVATSLDNIWTATGGLTPALTTSDPSFLRSTSATLNGVVDDSGDSSITVRGFQYGTTTNFAATTAQSGAFGPGQFNTAISGLSCGTTYYVRAFATNAAGTTLGRTRVFVPPCPTILTYSADVHGSIAGANSQLVEIGQNGTAVTAIAKAGYSFINWSDGSNANPRSDTNITSSLSFLANFAAITPPPLPLPTDGVDADAPLPYWATALLCSLLLITTVRAKRTY